MSDVAISIKSLSKVYTKKLTQKVQALQDVSFDIHVGKTFGFIGPNGAGKSTTIKILMGLLMPTSGEASILGINAAIPGSRQRVGYLAENPAYYDYLTPRELLLFVARNFGVSSDTLELKVEEVLRLIELDKAADRPIRHLSKGMVQRIGIGQTLVHDPDIYVLDEPMSGLDPLGRRLVSDIILDLKERGKTVFFSTHIIHDVERICDDVAILLDGRLKFSGSVRNVVNESFSRYEVVVRNLAVESLSFDNLIDVKVSKESDHVRLSIAKESLGVCLQHLDKISEIQSIEPERKTLEQIFIDSLKEQAP
jgi:ABC-2 type transport system ATP-binding protein